MPLWIYHAYQWMWGGIDLLFPPACGGCGQTGQRWCSNCQSAVSTLSHPLCEICGLPLTRSGLCPECKASPPDFETLRSWLVFDGPIRQALHRLKYRRDLGLADALAKPMSEWAARLNWQADLILPVPLGEKRYSERGYNQVALVAWPLAMRLGWRYDPQALTRSRETRSQVGLSALERRENVDGAFRADPRRVEGRSVIVMDDVATTGATLSACAQALQKAGAKRVYALTIARALPHHGLKIV